jgi:hypothetical protein
MEIYLIVSPLGRERAQTLPVIYTDEQAREKIHQSQDFFDNKRILPVRMALLQFWRPVSILS